jgi:hypothetical protein
MSSDGRFVSGFSARLFDFFFPTTGSSGAIQANAMSTQWQEFPDTLCRAPARQQFYNITAPGCVPFFPSGLEVVDAKDNATGFDVDFEAIESSYTMSCTSTATVVPFNDVTLVNQGAPIAIPTISPIQPVDDPSITLAASVTSLLQSSLDVGHLRRAVPTTASSSTSPAITDPAHLPERTLPQKLRKEPILNRRVEKRAEQPHAWCQENQLIISSYTGHSAVEVCESETSWGPDFVSLAEGIFCDMCQRQAYPLCSGTGGGYSTTTTASSDQASVTGTPSKNSPLLNTLGTCFDLDKKQLRAPARVCRDRSIPVKSYNSIRHWK